MTPTLARLAIAGLLLACPPSIRAQAQPTAAKAPAPETPGLRATQATIVLGKEGKRRSFRATVMARKDDLLTVLTAAHCISPDDADGPALLVVDGNVIKGTVDSVVRNPSYKPNTDREIPGPDNAIARFRFNPVGKTATEAFEAIKPAAGLASRAYPDPSGRQIVTVRMVDQNGVEHAVKAGNFSNPRLLEWGPAYKPIPGDSGSGVFVLAGGSEGKEPRPILIGIIVMTDDKGGKASLVSKDMRWIADELVK